MRKALLCSVLLTLLASAAYACGDKFLVAGRNPRYAQVRTPVHPASVLVFRNKMAGVRRASSNPDIKSTLEGVGHKVKVVDDAASLEKMLKSKKYDIVIADMEDTGSAQSAIQTASSKAVLVPAMFNPSVSEIALAKTEYKHLLQVPAEPNNIISVIQDTMALR